MMIVRMSRRMHRLLSTATLCLTSMTASAQEVSPQWPPESLRAAVQGCRSSIVDRATQDHLARHRLAESQLPKDFQARIGPVIEPYLRLCDCTIAQLSKEFPVDQFHAQTPEVQSRFKSLVTPGGVCAPKPGA